jgi:hypothetical protein
MNALFETAVIYKRVTCLMALVLFCSCAFIRSALAADLPVSISQANEPYKLSYAPGANEDRNFLGGTEFMYLVPFQGKLYGGVGYWMDAPDYFKNQPADPSPGPLILVLDSPRLSC